jgi:alkylated DNA repair dioxygenase AlkB
MQISLPDADLQLFPQHFPSETAENLLKGLKENIPWVQNRIKFYGKESLVPRLESWHGDAWHVLYILRYSNACKTMDG